MDASTDLLEPQFSQDAYVQMTRVGVRLFRSLAEAKTDVWFHFKSASYEMPFLCSVSQLLDLCILNINSLDFQYRVLAAAVCCHFFQQEKVEKLSGKIQISQRYVFN